MYEVGLNFLPKPQKEGKIFLMPIWDYNYTQVQIFLIINDHRNVTNSVKTVVMSHQHTIVSTLVEVPS